MSETLREGVERLLADSCHHCGRMPDADNDHTCLCPVNDSECLTHSADPVVSREHLRALLAATAPTPELDPWCPTCNADAPRTNVHCVTHGDLSPEQVEIERLTEELLLTDALTGNDDGTPSRYSVHSDDVEYLVKTVLELARPTAPTPDEVGLVEGRGRNGFVPRNDLDRMLNSFEDGCS